MASCCECSVIGECIVTSDKLKPFRSPRPYCYGIRAGMYVLATCSACLAAEVAESPEGAEAEEEDRWLLEHGLQSSA